MYFICTYPYVCNRNTCTHAADAGRVRQQQQVEQYKEILNNLLFELCNRQVELSAGRQQWSAEAGAQQQAGGAAAIATQANQRYTQVLLQLGEVRLLAILFENYLVELHAARPPAPRLPENTLLLEMLHAKLRRCGVCSIVPPGLDSGAPAGLDAFAPPFAMPVAATVAPI